jgi:hypothetical protein
MPRRPRMHPTALISLLTRSVEAMWTKEDEEAAEEAMAAMGEAGGDNRWDESAYGGFFCLRSDGNRAPCPCATQVNLQSPLRHFSALNP